MKQNLHIEVRTILSLGRGKGAGVVNTRVIKDGGHDAVTTKIYLARLVNIFLTDVQHSINRKTVEVVI